MKKIISFILVLCMLSSMSLTTLATELTNDVPASVDPTPVAEDPAPADSVAGDAVVSEGEVLADEIGTAGSGATITVEENAGVIHTDDTAADATPDVGGAVINQDITIDLGENNITIEEPSVGSPGTVTIGLQILKDNEVTIEGDGAVITFDGDSDGEGDGNPMLKRGIQNYADLTLDGVTIDGTDLANYTKVDGEQKFDAAYENIVISNCNGSLTIDNGAGVLAAEGDVALDVYAYTNGSYTDGPNVTIETDAGTIQGTIIFDGDAGCEEKCETLPTLDIKGGDFVNFVLEIGQAVVDFVEECISISGGTFDSKNVVGTNAAGEAYQFEDFLAAEHVVVEQDGKYVVMTKEAADALKAPVVAVIPENTITYVPAPAPVPEKVTTEVEVAGETVSVTLDTKTVTVEKVAPVVLEDEAPVAVNVSLDKAVLHEDAAKAEEIVKVLAETIIVKDADDETIDGEHYEISVAEDGTIEIKLAPEMLKKLGAGKHVLTVIIGGYEVEVTIVIK